MHSYFSKHMKRKWIIWAVTALIGLFGMIDSEIWNKCAENVPVCNGAILNEKLVIVQGK